MLLPLHPRFHPLLRTTSTIKTPLSLISPLSSLSAVTPSRPSPTPPPVTAASRPLSFPAARRAGLLPDASFGATQPTSASFLAFSGNSPLPSSPQELRLAVDVSPRLPSPPASASSTTSQFPVTVPIGQLKCTTYNERNAGLLGAGEFKLTLLPLASLLVYSNKGESDNLAATQLSREVGSLPWLTG